MQLRSKHIRILAWFEVRQGLRGAPGILAAVFLFLPLAWLLSKLGSNADTINSLASGNLSQEELFLIEAAKYLIGLDANLTDRILVDHSPFVSLMFALTAFGMPFLTMIASLEQNATDIGSKGIRFLLPRTSRDDLLLGRFLGTLIYWGLALCLAGVAVTVVALVLDQVHGASTVLLDGAWFTVGLLLIALPFVAFMSLCSVTCGNPLLSITMGLGAYLAIFLMGGLGGWFHEGLKVIRYVFPAPLRYDLMLGGPGEIAIAGVAMLVYTGLFLVGAGLVLRKRDL